jgi:hypothetical protein
MYQYAWIALDLANERTLEAARDRRDRTALGLRPSWPRRLLAKAFALNGRASMGIARRLDAVATK